MKFDTPADHEPDRPAQGRRQADRPHRRPVQDHRHRALRLRAPRRRRPTPPMASSLGAGIAKGRIARIDTAAAKAAPGVLAVVTTLDMPQARARHDEHRLPVRRRRDPALPPGDRRRGGRDLRAGPRRGLADPGRLRPRAGRSSTSRPRPPTAAPVGGRQRRGQRRRRRGARRRLRRAPSRRRP